MISDAGGTIWDTVFSVSQAGGDVELKMQMDVRPYKLLAKMTNALIRSMVMKGVESDMDAIKSFCESGGRPAES